MRTRSPLGILCLAPVLILSVAAVPQGLRAQQPDVASGPAARLGEASQGAPGPAPALPRAEAQAQAHLKLLELQKRQLAEQGKEQIRELQEQEREQIEQLIAEANRQVEQVRRQTKRLIEQVRQRAKWQQELLDSQMKIVEAQAGIRPEPKKEAAQTDLTPGPTARVEAGFVRGGRRMPRSVDERLQRILDQLGGIEQRLDRLEKRR